MKHFNKNTGITLIALVVRRKKMKRWIKIRNHLLGKIWHWSNIPNKRIYKKRVGKYINRRNVNINSK